MGLVSLEQYRSRDTVKLLEGLLAVAFTEGGSVTLTYRSPGGEERIGVTGAYATDKELALQAVNRMTIYLDGLDKKVRRKR